MTDIPEKKPSRASVEASLASKLPLLVHFPPGMAEQHLARCAEEALPDGTEQERAEFRRYWRERLDRERDHQDREREHSDREADRRLQILRGKAVAAGDKGLAQPLVRDEPVQDGGAAALPKPKDRSRKRGPKPDYETAVRVQAVVKRLAPDGDWRSKLDEISEALDEERIPFPQKWRRDRQCRCWSDCYDKSLVIKAIEYRLGTARQRRQPTPETLS
jgi:hypothetical protein